MSRIVFAVLLAVFATSAAAQTCSPPQVVRLAQETGKARAALTALLPSGTDDGTVVKPPMMTAIGVLQAKLRAFAGATMRCQKGTVAPKAAEAALRVGDDVLGFRAARPLPNVIAVTAEFGVGCGADTVFLVYAFQDGGWREILHLQARPYSKVDGAWGDFGYVFSRPDAKGRWFVATKTVAPWCSSTWSTIRYAAVRPGASRPFFEGEDSIWWGGEDMGRLRAGTDDFELRFHAESIDGDVHNREWVRRFHVAGDKAVRIAPFADSPRDFVEEWIKADWLLAKALTAPALVSAVREVHTRFHAEPHGEFHSLKRCKGVATEVQVHPTGTNGSLFFQVSGSPKDFRLTGLSNSADPRCRN